MENSKRMLLLVNPYAGKKQAQSSLCEIIDQLNKSGWRVEVHITQSSGDACEQAKKAEGHFDRVTAVGGDGTLNELISGVAGWNSRPDVGYIPMGTTNDFAASLGFPKEARAAARVAAEGTPFVCDIGRFEDRYFAYIAAFGMFTDVAYLTDQQAKNIFGRLAYLFQGALELGSNQGIWMKVVTEDQVIEGDFIFGAVTNSHSIGGFKGLLGEVYLDDGWLELLLIRRPKNAAELSELVSSLLSQQFSQKSGVFYAKVKAVSFYADQPVSWTLDGEDGGAHEEVTIECMPAAISFAAGDKESAVSTPVEIVTQKE